MTAAEDPASDAPRCRVCGRRLAPNRRGDHVDCCSRLVPPPQSHREGRRVLGWWVQKIESATLRFGELAAHVPAMAWAVVVLGLAVLALLCSGALSRL